MRSAVRIDRNRLRIRCDEAGIREELPIGEGGRVAFDRWVRRYATLIEFGHSPTGLLALGQEMHDWLNRA